MAIARRLSGRQATAMAYKLPAGQLPAQPIRRSQMNDRHGWKPISLADDDEDGDDEEEDEDDDE
jgi:hypothetical protein